MMRNEAKALFQEHNRYGKALLNHNERIAAFTLSLADRYWVQLDLDMVYTAAMLHDVGLLVKDPSERSYLKRGAQFARPYLSDWGADETTASTIEEMLLYNHSLRPVKGAGQAAELIRRAVQIEHSRGVLLYGLNRAFVDGAFDTFPRLDLTKVLIDFARITVFEDGPGQLVPMFFPRH